MVLDSRCSNQRYVFLNRASFLISLKIHSKIVHRCYVSSTQFPTGLCVGLKERSWTSNKIQMVATWIWNKRANCAMILMLSIKQTRILKCQAQLHWKMVCYVFQTTMYAHVWKVLHWEDELNINKVLIIWMESIKSKGYTNVQEVPPFHKPVFDTWNWKKHLNTENTKTQELTEKHPNLFVILQYCWWKKSCTSWYGKYPLIFMVFYIPGGCRNSSINSIMTSGYDTSCVCVFFFLGHSFSQPTGLPRVCCQQWVHSFLQSMTCLGDWKAQGREVRSMPTDTTTGTKTCNLK